MTDRSLEKNFEALFEHAPEVVGYAPGRVNIIGDHTDYNEGFVLPAAIQMGTSIAASRRDDNRICAFAESFTHTIDQFSLDTIELLQDGNNATAGLYVILTFSLCPVLAWCGWLVGDKFLIWNTIT